MKEILLSDTAKLILGCYVYPHRNIYGFQNALEIVVELIKLLEKHGDCPSVETKGSEPETICKDRLAGISLKEHTYGVTLNMVKAIKKSITDYNVHMPRAIITGLAHDIGKIPKLRSAPDDDAQEHQMVSTRWLREKFQGKNQLFSKQVINAVENHHSYLKDDFACMLKKADMEARQTELVRSSRNPKIASLDTWFSVEDLYKRIELYINFYNSYTKWTAFTFREFVYCKPALIYETAKALCKESNILDPMFLYDSLYEKAFYKIISLLREYDFTPNLLGKDKFHRLYVIKDDMDLKHKARLTILKPAGFYRMNEMEKRKTGFFKNIKSVYPC